eukprot:TRINITY_DN18259_c0_g1_i2.p1 TRINITY_DN18259_c0_g1~~TRINITY_DN18259_c0_g1_i2.p1  ORF type:complete len:609 (+),score=282.07 TRINITY_DN18259_c0_g1_i2:45-1871(+)
MSDDRIPSFHTDTDHDADVYRFGVKGKGHQEYYVLYGEHVDSIAREFLHTTTVVKQAGTGKDACPYLNISQKVFSSMAWDLLQKKRHKVEIYESSGGSWRRIVAASPGRLEQFEARFGAQGSQDTGCIASIQCTVSQTGIVTLSCAYVNQTLRLLGYAEFSDVSTNFSNLESFLLQVGAKEAIIPSDSAAKLKDNEAKIRDVLKGANVHLECVKRKEFKSDTLQDRLQFLLREGCPTQDILELPECAEALSGVIAYLNLSGDSCNEAQFVLVRDDLSKFMKLDLAAVRALNIFDDEMDTANRHKGSLLSFLDSCSTPMGKRQLKMWMTQPLLDLDVLRRRQDIVQVFMDDAMLRDALRTSVLNKVPDLDKILKKVQRQRATLADCMKIGQFTDLIPKVIILLEAYEGDYKGHITSYLEMLQEKSDALHQLASLVTESLEVDETDREVRIKPSFDDSLQELADAREQLRNQINADFKKTLTAVSQTDKEVKLEYSTAHNHHYRATKKGMPAVEKRKKDMQVIETRKDGLKFWSKGLASINAEWKTLSADYEERQGDLITMFKETFGSYLEPLDSVTSIISELDILVSFAAVSTRPDVKQYIRPTYVPVW